MGGRGRRRRPVRNKNPSNRTPDHPTAAAAAAAGRVNDRSRAGVSFSRRPRRGSFSDGGAFRYSNPAVAPAESGHGEDDPTSPILLTGSGGSQIAAFIDREPCSESPISVPAYEYDPMIVGGAGLGFHADEEVEMAEVEGEEGAGFVGFSDSSPPEIKKKEKRGGFLSIGGMRIDVVGDTSSPEDDDGGSDDYADSDSVVSFDGESSESCSNDEEEEDDGDESSDESAADNESDIDDELVQDYVEGIGGSEQLLSTKWMAAMNLDEHDEDIFLKSAGGSDRVAGKLGRTEIMKASEHYGVKKPKAQKGKSVGRPSEVGSSAMNIKPSALDELMFVKDIRSISRKKKSPSKLSTSWPLESQRSKKYYGIPGEKKKHRKEQIAMKRRERMMNRGVDLDLINMRLRQMVVSKADLLSFQPMHSRDCSQVCRLASIYHLRSGCQGSGKKRFVTVMRTVQTCLPSSRDKLRLDKLLGEGIETSDFVIYNGEAKSQMRANGNYKGGRRHASSPASAPTKLAKNHEASGRRKQTGRRSLASYAEQPVSFVSCGVMEGDSVPEPMAVDTSENEKIAGPSEFASFEMHTKGFGSKMMAKMGFVEGSGLGRDGQGMVRPIEAIQRPKSLGLGVQFTETISDVSEAPRSIEAARNTASLGKHRKGKDPSTSSINIGAFEKHTTGFGSRMMAKMGFTPGMGLGRDAQGITTPLTARKLPKSRGLGANV